MAFPEASRTAVRSPGNYEPLLTIMIGTSPHNVNAWNSPLRAYPSGLKTLLSRMHISKDGGLMAAVSNSMSVVLMNMATKAILGQVDMDEAVDIVMSSDGQKLLLLTSNSIEEWDLAPRKWQLLATFLVLESDA
ncbi:MAG TPA: hypothetical protein VEX68_21485 [Bryobacteraceae bacterium]|nr:hypothetical protein [Bryobacteraceae bacterium]